jgi:hypothetical protein
LNADLFSNHLTAVRLGMGRFSGLGFNSAPPARLVGACILAGLIGMGIAFLAAVVAGRTSVPGAAFQHADIRADFPAAALPTVTFDRRRDRLDHPPRRAAKADFLAETVVPPERSRRTLKSIRHVQTHITEPVKAVVDNVPGQVTTLLPGEASIRGIAADVEIGPVSLIGPAFEAAVSEGTQRAQGARPERQSRDLGRTAPGGARSVSGAARSVSGVAGRATGALGL